MMTSNMIQILCILLIASVYSFQQKITLPFTFTNKVAIPNKNCLLLQCHSNEGIPMDTENSNEPKTKATNVPSTENMENEKDLKNEYETLLNRCCGEVNETDELEQLERDFFEIYQKMKKYNKKRITQTKHDIYKLLRTFKQ